MLELKLNHVSKRGRHLINLTMEKYILNAIFLEDSVCISNFNKAYF